MADYSIPETLDYLLSFKLQDLSLFSYHIYYQSTHTNPYQTHYFQTIITTTNISIITFFQSFTHIIHYPFIKSNITIKHYQFCLTHTIPSQRNDIHFTQHSLSFISHYSTIISSFLFNITEYNHGNIIFIIHYSYHSFLISIYIYTLISYQFYSYLTIHVNHFLSHRLQHQFVIILLELFPLFSNIPLSFV